MALSREQPLSFFPTSDAAILQSNYGPPIQRPSKIGPVLDVEHAQEAIEPWTIERKDAAYPAKVDMYDPAPIPDRPEHIPDRYLLPMLSENERLRLTMLWYYTRNSVEDIELQSRLQKMVHLAQETVGWEFVIIGLLDHNTFTRLVTVGLPLAVLPRRESTCAHTVNQQPDTVFVLPNMAEDWRFQKSPHVDIGGLRAYAGAPLCVKTEFGHTVALGSICVASNSQQKPLSKAQQLSLVRLADWVVADIVHSARARRQRERRRMLELISQAKQVRDNDGFQDEDAVMEILKTVYPRATINTQVSPSHAIHVDGRNPIPLSDFENCLWEDSEHLEYFLNNLNQLNLDTSKVVRVVAAGVLNNPTPTYLVVASRDFRLVFDDIDSWFVQTCSSMLAHIRQGRLLEEANSAKERFLRGITHQLRTPIHGILGSVELLAEELKSYDAPKSDVTHTPTSAAHQVNSLAYLETIKASGKELISTINSMIKLNRWTEIAQAGRQDALHQFRDLETILMSELNQTLSHQILSRSSLFFHYDLPSNCDSLVIDMDPLKDCILALVTNALQHTPKGVVAVTAKVTESFDRLTIDVQDTGIGIHASDHVRIFDAYEKVDVHTTGAGLGLTLASRLATLLNGTITLVDSSLQQGAHFKFAIENPALACQLPGPLKPNLHALPSTFHSLPAEHGTQSLVQDFTKQLVSCGLIPAHTPEQSVLITELPSDWKDPNDLPFIMGPEQVAICLLQASVNLPPLSSTSNGKTIVYAKSPFTSSSLNETLQIANALIAQKKRAALKNSSTGPCTQSTLIKDLPIRTLSSTYPEMALLVDDNPTNLRIMQLYCTKRRIPYLSAADGQQAIDLFSARSSPSPSTTTMLILMDLQMPICDGVTATRTIRQLERERGWRKAVVFIVTGQDSKKDREEAGQAGADRYFVKPLGMKALDRGIGEFWRVGE